MSIYKHTKTNRWVAQTGKPKRQIGTFATRREAVAAVNAEQAKVISSYMTVEDWRTQWLQSDRWKESTRMHNAERTQSFVKAYGNRRMCDIDRALARSWLRTAPSSIQALSSMFGAAIYEDALTVNPFSKLQRSVTKKRDLRPEWLTDKDITALETSAVQCFPGSFGESMAAMVRFAAETGIRPGELFAVEDHDLDPVAGALYVRRAAESKTRRITTPKNGQEREVVLSKRAAEAAGQVPRHAGVARLFSTVRGEQFWLPNFHRVWTPIAAGAGRPTMDWYELRHFCATALLERGMSERDVSIQLGHTDGGELVRKVYGHPSEREARDRVRAVMNRGAAA